MSMTSSTKKFGSVRSFFWPIHRHELPKLLPMMFLCFLITFNYNMLRNSKDAIVVTAKLSGAQIIPFIKVYVLLPMALGITYIFAKLSNRFDREHVFYWMISIFLGFFFVFTFILYPVREHLHLHTLANYLQEVLPRGMSGAVAMIRYWSFTAYYVMSELWGTAIFSVVFWGFANQITKVNEAKRFYGLIAISANCTAIVSGFAGRYLSQHSSDFLGNAFGGDPWHQALVMITVLVLSAGVTAVITYRSLHNYMLRTEGLKEERISKKKTKMSMRENFSILGTNSYLRNIAIVVVAYNLTINLVEIIWKDQIKMLYPNTSDFYAYMNTVTIGIGIAATIGAFISGKCIRKFGWTTTAMLTPTLLILTSVAFFGALFAKDNLGFVSNILPGVTPLMVVVFFGSLQNIFLRGCKFTVFDNTKEIAFVPLNREVMMKGKAAIDGVGSRFGKSGGSIIHQGLLMFLGSVAASAPFVAGFLTIFGGAWLYSVKGLGRQFNALTSKPEEATSAEEVPDAVPVISGKTQVAMAGKSISK